MFTLAQVVPWGRSFDEYRRMFALSETDRERSILGCADGPASFNAEATARGWRVTSIDPLYRHTAAEIRERVTSTFDEVIDQTRRNAHEFVWAEPIPSIDALARLRAAAMNTFLDDYPCGRQDGRYVQGELPSLPFGDREFSVALCSHFLFLYSTQLTADFHIAAARELCRVADEVRIFPLLALGATPSAHVPIVERALRGGGFTVSIDTVAYEFVRGGNQMMRIVTRSAAPAGPGRADGA